jgi:hypothetical protein
MRSQRPDALDAIAQFFDKHVFNDVNRISKNGTRWHEV